MNDIARGSVGCRCALESRPTRLVAITGGPGAGKTAVLEMARRALCEHVGFLPEAAGILFGGGFPRGDSIPVRRAAQRAIFHVQRELEALALEQDSVGVALCDRGTIDGLAYWPDSPQSYWYELGTSHPAELQRYAAVIHLQTPSIDQGYNHDNHLRTESAAQALEIDKRIERAWATHPRRTMISSRTDFLEKATLALAAIRAELSTCCLSAPPA